jgi:hypothetical protein
MAALRPQVRVISERTIILRNVKNPRNEGADDYCNTFGAAAKNRANLERNLSTPDSELNLSTPDSELNLSAPDSKLNLSTHDVGLNLELSLPTTDVDLNLEPSLPTPRHGIETSIPEV